MLCGKQSHIKEASLLSDEQTHPAEIFDTYSERDHTVSSLNHDTPSAHDLFPSDTVRISQTAAAAAGSASILCDESSVDTPFSLRPFDGLEVVQKDNQRDVLTSSPTSQYKPPSPAEETMGCTMLKSTSDCEASPLKRRFLLTEDKIIAKKSRGRSYATSRRRTTGCSSKFKGLNGKDVKASLGYNNVEGSCYDNDCDSINKDVSMDPDYKLTRSSNPADSDWRKLFAGSSRITPAIKFAMAEWTGK